MKSLSNSYPEISNIIIATPSDMTCYTPEPADESATPVSPPEIQSPSRETPYPLSYGKFPDSLCGVTPYKLVFYRNTLIQADPNQLDSIPDLIIDNNSPFPLSMHHDPSRRTYHHPSESIVHSTHPHAQHQPPPHIQHPHAHHPHAQPHPQHQHQQQHPHPHPHPHLPHPQHTLMSTTTRTMPPIQTVEPAVPVQPVAAPGPRSSNRDFMSTAGIMPAAPNIVPHSNEWERLDSFQTHLEELNARLNESMSKWNRDQDPNEVPHHPHHEGLGL